TIRNMTPRMTPSSEKKLFSFSVQSCWSASDTPSQRCKRSLRRSARRYGVGRRPDRIAVAELSDALVGARDHGVALGETGEHLEVLLARDPDRDGREARAPALHHEHPLDV